MGIVVITMPGDSKRAFANALHEETQGAVDLVIIQDIRPASPKGFFVRILNALSRPAFLGNLRYSFLLRVSPRIRRTLKYFRETSLSGDGKGYAPPVLRVASVNGDEAYEAVRKLSPQLVVVWGSRILQPRLIAASPKVINLHMGLCPSYRGTLANQCAVLNDDESHIGATIHYVAEKVDAGDVITLVKPDISLPPQALFRDLNDRAMRAFVSISALVFAGEQVPRSAQDSRVGKNLLLRQWTPELRWKTALRMRRWEKGMLPSVAAAAAHQKNRKLRTM